MASLQAWFWYYACSAISYKARHFTPEQHLDRIADTYAEANGPQQVPPALMADPDIDVAETYFHGSSGNDSWQVHTFTPKVQDSKRIVLYFHGGGFVKPADEREYAVAGRIARDYHCPVIHPAWTLAPCSNALQFPTMAVDFVLKVADDSRYQGKEIWLGGLSAGGWCALRLLLALCEEGMNHSDETRRQRVNGLLDRIPGVFLFCPAVTLEMDEESYRVGRLDSLLSSSLVERYARIWCYGAAYYPRLYDRLPADLQSRARDLATATDDATLLDPRFSISQNVDLLSRYIEDRGRSKPFSISSFIGSYDILYPGVRNMHSKLSNMSREVVVEDLTVAPGSGHAYMVLAMPETEQLWSRMSELLR